MAQNIDQATLKRLLAGETVDGMWVGRGNYTGPQITEADDGSSDPNNYERVIYRGDPSRSGRMKSAWDTWNIDGTYRGQGTADSDLASGLKFGATALGGYYGVNALANAGLGAVPAGNGAFLGEAAWAPTAAAGEAIASPYAAGLTAVEGGAAASSPYAAGLTAAPSTAAAGASPYAAGLSAVPAAANAEGGATAAKAITSGWDILDKVGTAALTAGAVGAVSNALAPDTDTSRINALIDGMITDQGIARDRSKTMWDDYIATWKPIEQRFAQTALNYDTPERRQQAANEASGQVASQYDTARTVAERDAIAAGVDPSTIATLGLNSRILEAKDRAGAENQARTGVETRGLSLLQGAANFGRNMPNSSLAQAGQANSTANSAVSAQNSANATDINATNARNAVFGDIIGAGATVYGLSNAKNSGGSRNWWDGPLWGN